MNLNWQQFLNSIEHLTGFVIVMLALSSLWGLTVLMAKIVAIVEGRKAPAAAAAPAPVVVPAAAEPAVVAVEAGPSDDDFVVIAAAVASILDARHRVVAVKPVSSSWGQQGRRDIHASHRIR